MYFLTKKINDDDKKYYINDRFFVSNWNFTIEHIKIVKSFQGFSRLKKFKLKVFQGFKVNPDDILNIFFLNLVVQAQKQSN